MKSLFSKYFVLLILASSCNTNTDEKSTEEIAYQKFIIRYPTDTINFLDANGRKQGLWVDLNSKSPDRLIYKDDTAYTFTDSTVQNLIKTLNSK